MEMYLLLALGTLFSLAALTTLFAIFLRRVVPTNEVHIVQSAKKTRSYGKDTGNGNTYYEWPAFLPILGITKIKLNTSNFTLRLDNYEAYDKGRLPFIVDVAAFFRVSDSNIAAQRISSFDELLRQLTAVVQGAVRSILANNEIEEIMQGRSKFGEQFSQEVGKQLSNWGVEPVKNIELMDIRDSKESHVIRNIMEKKKSHIEMESRTEVAKNQKFAQIAEIEALKEINLQEQVAKQSVGLRTIENERQVSVSKQEAMQAIKEQEKATKLKEMSILEVENVRRADITKQMEVIKAQQDQQTAVIKAEAHKQSTILVAQGQLGSKELEAKGITAEGNARADAEKAMQLAPVEAQIVLAKEIGGNAEYQEYLVTIEKINAARTVGVEQAKALQHADIKVITNSGAPTSGLTSVMDLFSSKGGTEVGAMLEALANTEKGSELLGKVLPAKKAAPLSNGKSV